MNTTVVILLVVGAAVLAGGGFLFLRSRAPKEEPVYRFNCPNCKRRLRYRGKQSGHHGACPRCKQPFLFPAVPGGPVED
jgi:hypothetical protein